MECPNVHITIMPLFQHFKVSIRAVGSERDEHVRDCWREGRHRPWRTHIVIPQDSDHERHCRQRFRRASEDSRELPERRRGAGRQPPHCLYQRRDSFGGNHERAEGSIQGCTLITWWFLGSVLFLLLSLPWEKKLRNITILDIINLAVHDEMYVIFWGTYFLARNRSYISYNGCL